MAFTCTTLISMPQIPTHPLTHICHIPFFLILGIIILVLDCYSSFQAPILQPSLHPPTHSNTLVVPYFKEFVKLQNPLHLKLKLNLDYIFSNTYNLNHSGNDKDYDCSQSVKLLLVNNFNGFFLWIVALLYQIQCTLPKSLKLFPTMH